ncbi:MAG: DNA topoisomerase (ATP-hydrolyzing) subunit B [Mycoplasma sp.]|nr:DNA topoisomerase (ATP-hydrolyzing) subunit B [Mycoplasma sp.]
MKNKIYDASSIRVLKGLEAVRTRPGMYVGTKGIKGLHHLIWEIVDNSIDEAMAGYCSNVIVSLNKDGSVTIEDDGRGIPVEIHSETNLSTVETVLTTLHAGGKFDSNSYKVSGGLHGVGASVVNALSSELEVWVYKNNKTYYMKFENGGFPTKPLEVIGDTEKHGTTIRFLPDFQIMDKNEWDFNAIADRLRQTAYLNKGLKLKIFDNRDDKNVKKEFYFEGGIIEYVKALNIGKELIHKDVIYADGKVAMEKSSNVIVEIAFQYNSGFQTNLVSYANNIATIEGGTHEQGFLDALIRIFNNYAIENKIFKNEKEKLTRDDVKEGLTAIISIKHTDPIFEGQTKAKLGNKDARFASNKVVSQTVERFLAENPKEARKIIEKSLLAQSARFAAQNAREATRRKSPLDIASLPGKLADCAIKNAEDAELYIVEGNSAGGSAKMGRNREFQAILPLRGKVINSEKARIDKVFQNQEIGTIITALGAGVASEFNINKLRYHKIIIMTDADVDGSHIRTLLLTFFYRYFKKIIEYGFLYIAQPPLYKVQQNKQIIYAYSEKEKQKTIESLDPNQKIQIQRYKGLGEMNPEQLWETTMNPINRKMLQVQIDDAAAADYTFSILMGEDVKPRRDFINENAKYVEVDI